MILVQFVNGPNVTNVKNNMTKECEYHRKKSDCNLWVRCCEECSHYKDPNDEVIFKKDVLNILDDIVLLISKESSLNMTQRKTDVISEKINNIRKKLK